MKAFRLIAATMFLAAIATLPAYAQQRPATTTPPAAPQTGGSVNVPESKIAFVSLEAMQDEKAGVTRLVNAMKGVNREFEPRQKEIQGLQQEVQRLTKEIEDQSKAGVVAPASLQAKAEQLDQKKKELQRKAEDAQAAYNKRMADVMKPIYDEIGKALNTYASQRGINVLFDSDKIGPAVIIAIETVDITRPFIAEFNSKNPATASTAAPGR